MALTRFRHVDNIIGNDNPQWQYTAGDFFDNYVNRKVKP